jgi:23S rRNA pseudouridine1911/1915/1917 synthase
MYQNFSLEFCVVKPTKLLPRLDVYLQELLVAFTRSRLQKLIEEGQVLVDHKKVKSGFKLKGAELICINFPADVPSYIEPQEIQLDVIFEDEYLIVINKPAGMVTHPGAGNRNSTLVNALLHHCKGSLSGISGILRPGIVHRLDKDTSGLLVVAKQDLAHVHLAEQIRNKTAKRSYHAVLEGILPAAAGTIDKPIGRAPIQRKQMAIIQNGKKAISHFKVLAKTSKYTLVEVILETGRTHQIRVHMADLGCPVVGDIVYNHKKTGSLAARQKLGLVGHALHAYKLSFCHPVTNQQLEFEAALPPDLEQLIGAIIVEKGQAPLA